MDASLITIWAYNKPPLLQKKPVSMPDKKEPDDRPNLQDAKDRYQVKFDLVRLMPEEFHRGVCAERAQECNNKQGIFGCSPRVFLRFMLVIGIREKCPPVYYCTAREKKFQTSNGTQLSVIVNGLWRFIPVITLVCKTATGRTCQWDADPAVQRYIRRLSVDQPPVRNW